VEAAVESGADAVLVNPGEAVEVTKLGAVVVVSEEDAPGVGVVVFPLLDPKEANGVLKGIETQRSRGRKTAALVEVKDKESERAAVELGKVSDFLLVTARDWKIIPLENIIAQLQSAGTTILAGVKDADEAKTAVQTLEVGTAGVLLNVQETGPEEIKKTCEILEKLEAEKLELRPAVVRALRPVGMGDRACIDTTSLMGVGEGMLVGSQAGGLFLVHSETLPTEFVEPRPFRVNAGAVHAYIRIPGGKTRYMSELRAGDEVLIVNAEGESRVGTIGRVKIERRPLILVEVEHEGKSYKTLLQHAETINLVGRDGKPIPVTRLNPGDEVLIYVEPGGRHFGVRVEETLIEK
jgi:3-dehydroquinate synthase II